MEAAPPGTGGKAATLAAFLRCVCDGARLMVGQPNYETYAEHMRRTHPDQAPMTRVEFFRDCENRRFGGGNKGGFRCC
jgi:uncharacterized short protein YbdD (DUF466 family)